MTQSLVSQSSYRSCWYQPSIGLLTALGNARGWPWAGGPIRSSRGPGWRPTTKHIQGAHPGDSYQQRRSDVPPGDGGRAGDRHSCNIAQAGAEGHRLSWSGAPGPLLWLEGGWAGPEASLGFFQYWARERARHGGARDWHAVWAPVGGWCGRTYAPTHRELEALTVMPFALTGTSTALSSIFLITDGCLLLFSSCGQGAVEIYRGCCSWSSLLQTARGRQWGPELRQEPGRGCCSVAA